jgi:hypothetical protein
MQQNKYRCVVQQTLIDPLFRTSWTPTVKPHLALHIQVYNQS